MTTEITTERATTVVPAEGGSPAQIRSERPEWGTILTIARKELRDAMRDRWFWLYAGAFALLASTLALIALSDDEVAAFGGFGRAAASLVALAQLVIPLMGLTLGARGVAGQRERGTLRLLLSHPISRTEAFLGMYLGSAAALAAAVAAGFGIAGVLGAIRSSSWNPAVLAEIAFFSWVLAVSMLGVGMLVSVLARRVGTALGVALFVWLIFTFLGDLGIMGTAVATQLPVNVLFFSVLANPVEAFRLLAMIVLHGSLDVLGPAGSYAVDRFGDSLGWLVAGALVVWAALPTVAAWQLFRRRVDV